MIGRFEIDAPPIDDSLSQMVETHRAKTGQDYGAILLFGLWGTVDCSAEVRLYAAYEHLKTNPEDGPAWLETALVHLETGEAGQAEAIIDELLRLNCPGIYSNLYSEDPEVYRAHIHADAGNLDRALEILDSLRVRHGDSPTYHHTLGTVLQAKGDFAGATAAFEEALEVLEDFRREAEEEDMIEDLNVDFPAVRAFLEHARDRAAREQPFDGERPLDLSGFREDIVE